MQTKLGYHLYACGKNGIPKQITFGANIYLLGKVLKHDFFAATALYESDNHGKKPQSPTNLVLKLSRKQHFLGLPLLWLGEILCHHEVAILKRLSNLRRVPRLLSRHGKTGFLYEYIEGHTLSEPNKNLPNDFFDRLLQLLHQIHQRNIAYLDMNKRSNIILGPDGQPYLIDFQISLHIGRCFLLSRRLATYLRDTLQTADLYHLFKHKRKLSPQLLRPEEKHLSHCTSGLIRSHRLAATPLRKLRRTFLQHLRTKGLMVMENTVTRRHEN